MEAENVMTPDFTTKVGYEFAIRWTLEFAIDFGDAMMPCMWALDMVS